MVFFYIGILYSEKWTVSRMLSQYWLPQDALEKHIPAFINIEAKYFDLVLDQTLNVSLLQPILTFHHNVAW